MIHFKIISASNLPSTKKNKYCNSYAILYPQNFDFPPLNYLVKTQTIKNTPNPEWNQDFLIPFTMCNSIRVEFWESKTFNDVFIGEGYIYFQSDLFYTNTSNAPQTSSITLSNPSSGCHSTFTYSISPSLTSFDIKTVKKTEQIYAYLTFDPPIQPKEPVDIQLCSYGVNENGTIVDPISDIYTRGESEATHNGPTGPTQVYYFRSTIEGSGTTYQINERYFFYVKNSGYSGRITLNFLNAPYSINSKKFIEKCVLFNSQWSVYVNNKNTNNHSYSVFPIQLRFKKNCGIVEPLTLPQNIVHQSVPDRPNTDTNTNADLFKSTYDYYHSNLDGIAVKTITDSMGQFLCPPQKNLHYRFEILTGNRYSLIGAFDYNNINQHPSKIMVGLGWDTLTDLDASIIQFCEDGTQIHPVCFYNQSNKNGSIRTTGDNLTGDGRGDDERIYLKLDDIPQNIKYLGIVITSFRSVPFCKINGAFCRIVDTVSGKEVMYLNLSKKDCYTGLLFAVMTRLDGVWDMWPCLKYFNGTDPQGAQKFFDNFVKTGVIDQFLKI